MIEIYRRVDGRDRVIKTFDSFEDFFRQREIDDLTLAEFGHDPAERIKSYYLFEDNVFEWVPYKNSDWMTRRVMVDAKRCRYICYEDFNLVTPDRLVGLYRNWWINRPRRRYYWHHAGFKRGVWGWYRAPKTTNEKRWARAWDDDEFAPKNGFARGKRGVRMLPDAWDDVGRHADKCWKSQSKRRHQWRP